MSWSKRTAGSSGSASSGADRDGGDDDAVDDDVDGVDVDPGGGLDPDADVGGGAGAGGLAARADAVDPGVDVDAAGHGGVAGDHGVAHAVGRQRHRIVGAQLDAGARVADRRAADAVGIG
jgi:hypothetical protein